MHEDRIRQHIAEVARREDSQARTLAQRFQRTCWPGGAADRSEPAARGWLQRWHPARAAAALPACSCARGRCAVCN